ncbi:MAG: DUF58 domain-containing protein [Oscillospiraceae bacterium]|nr:DUF58 domain-containing protein [Oscillospiraceae bacterium]
MLGRRITYGTVLACSFLFYCFFEEWFAWILLLMTACLPIFSLAVSLVPMLMTKWTFCCPQRVQVGVPARIAPELSGPLPAPPVRCRVKLQNRLTGDRYVGEPGEHVPTDHCGLVSVTCHKPYIYDYLGLFRWKLKNHPERALYVWPRPIAQDLPATVAQRTVTLWRPKPGGGFSENHDLRLYRPGDDLRNIHWKMAAKTGKLIYREAMEPVQKELQLTLTLSGTPEELDRKLGRLLYLSSRLLEQELTHQVVCHVEKGCLTLPVTDVPSQEQMLRTLLATPATKGEAIPPEERSSLACYIGGEPG